MPVYLYFLIFSRDMLLMILLMYRMLQTTAVTFILLTEIDKEMDLDIACTHCSNDYRDDNLPRLLTCGHTFCHNCLIILSSNQTSSTIICPEHQTEITIPNSIDQLPANFSLIKIMEGRKKNSSNNSSTSIKDASFDISKINREEECQEDEVAQQLISAISQKKNQENSELLTEDLPEDPIEQQKIEKTETNPQQSPEKKEEVQLCLLHQRQIEVVCMKDFERLCSKCALFGQHKGHQFKSVEQIQREYHKYEQQILNLFDQKASLIEHFTDKSIQKQLLKLLAAKASNLKRQIAERFRKLAEQLQKTEKNIYKKLDEVSCIISKRIENNLTLDTQIMNYYQIWETNTLQTIKYAEKNHHEGHLNFYLKRLDMHKQGKEILNRMQVHQNKAYLQTEKIIQDFSIGFHQTDFLNSLPNLAFIFQHGKDQGGNNNNEMYLLKENESTLANREKVKDTKKGAHLEKHESDESLLQFGQAQTDSISMANSQILDQSFVSAKSGFIPKPKQQTIRCGGVKKNASTFTAKERVSVKQSTMSSTLSNGLSRQAIKKKLKGLKIPEKYQKIMEGVINDSIQTIDFTNAQLGDNTILQIMNLMKSNTRMKTLKLIRNKLSDEGVASMIPFISNVITLNLSQNQLTQQTLTLIADNRHNLPMLKTLILSQTKIVERKSKVLIQKLKKMDLAVSV